MLLYALIIIAIVAIYMFVHKLIYKNIMQKKLGRKVEDRELTSLTSWMSAPDTPKSGGPSDGGKANLGG